MKVRLVGLTANTGVVEVLEVEVLEVEVLEVEVELVTITVIGTVFVVAPLAVMVTVAL